MHFYQRNALPSLGMLLEWINLPQQIWLFNAAPSSPSQLSDVCGIVARNDPHQIDQPAIYSLFRVKVQHNNRKTVDTTDR